jgi:hypothetical protein|tara:strand:+ start:1175 stop:1606 length:432 start_codon:yes stop_codon:yes gene_type:complete
MSEQKSKKSTKKNTKSTKPTKSRGLGDEIAKVTKATGIKKVVDYFADATGLDCGCEARQEALNRKFPTRNVIECLNEGEYTTLTQFFENFNGNIIEEKYTEPLARIHSRVFGHAFAIPCTCSPKEWKRLLGDLRGVYATYEGA